MVKLFTKNILFEFIQEIVSNSLIKLIYLHVMLIWIQQTFLIVN